MRKKHAQPSNRLTSSFRRGRRNPHARRVRSPNPSPVLREGPAPTKVKEGLRAAGSLDLAVMLEVLDLLHRKSSSESIAPIIVAAFSERRTPRLQRRSDTSQYSFLTAAPKVFGAAKMVRGLGRLLLTFHNNITVNDHYCAAFSRRVAHAAHGHHAAAIPVVCVLVRPGSDDYSDSTGYVKSERAVNRLAAATYSSPIAK
jgi:hypothetical protein